MSEFWTLERGRGAALALAAAGGVAALILGGCSRPPVNEVQEGFRGTGLQQMINPRTDAETYKLNKLPEIVPAADADGPPATLIFQNIQVLKDLSIGQFTRVMLSMAQWVAPPEQSCNYCHVTNMASDERYTKRVARRMLYMTRHINQDWKKHVGNTGVVCYTCHRGNPVPKYVWFINPGLSSDSGWIAGNAGKNKVSPVTTADGSALPYDPFTPFLLEDNNIRVIATKPLRGSDYSSIKQADYTYALMLSITKALGVNCTYCHNTRSFAEWGTSTPMRATAWYGIRMVRDLNNNILVPLTSTFPKHRLGVEGDVAKIYCATCHQGVFKPLYGESLAKYFPELQGWKHEPGTDPTTPPPPPIVSPYMNPAAAPETAPAPAPTPAAASTPPAAVAPPTASLVVPHPGGMH